MTLATMAELVCAKVRKTDAASLAACQDFLRQRHEMIYDAGLWKDTVGLFTVSLELDTSGIPAANDWRREVIMPSEVARVIGVRWNEDDTELQPDSLGRWLAVTPDVFEELGRPARFAEIESVGLSWTPTGLGTQLVFTITDARDVGVMVQVEGLDVSLATFEEVTLTAGSTPTVLGNWSSVRAISKPVTYGYVIVTYGSKSTRIAPHHTVSRHARIRLDRVPDYDATAATPTLLVLAKRRITSFVRDSDAPMIRGSDNALIAFAQGDMLERERQYAKAQAKVAEGQAMIQLMLDGERNQGAAVTRLTPTVEPLAGGVDDFGW